ncbi:MAG: hypothetical protein JNN07_06105 [Verrucomicrobiales bacterium]|nr:hypothetical protein [Verrucomicrobiales bacterium]
MKPFSILSVVRAWADQLLSRRNFRFSLLVAILASLPASARADWVDVARYGLGDDDRGAAQPKIITATRDRTGGRDLQAIGSPTYTLDVPGLAAEISGGPLCAQFNGIDQALGRDLLDVNTESFGVEAWVYPRTTVGNHAIVYNGDTRTSGWGLYQVGDTYGILFGGVKLATGGTVRPNTWTHLAFVRTSGYARLYINSQPMEVFITLPPLPPTGGKFVLGSPGQGGNAEYFNGRIDDVRVFTFPVGEFATTEFLYSLRRPSLTGLPATDISPNTLTVAGRVNPNGSATESWFEFGLGSAFDRTSRPISLPAEKSPTLVTNVLRGLSPGLAYDVRLVASNRAGITYGYLGRIATAAIQGLDRALSLNGQEQYVQLPPGNYFTRDFTIESWVRVKNYTNWGRLLDFGNGPAMDNVVFALSTGTTGQPSLTLYRGSQPRTYLFPTPLPLDEWLHLAVVVDGDRLKFYHNGRLVSEQSGVIGSTVGLRTQNFIGRSNWPLDGYANADIDELRIWQVARSPEEIRRDLVRELSGSETDLMVYFRFDQELLASAIPNYASQGSELSGNTAGNPQTIPGVSFPLPISANNIQASTPGPGQLEVHLRIPSWYESGRCWIERGSGAVYQAEPSPAPFQTTPGGSDTQATLTLANLPPEGDFHYRIGLSNRWGIAYSPDQTAALSTVVKNLNDAGEGSLRQALQRTVDEGFIRISPDLSGTLLLSSGELRIDRSLRIDGPGAAQLTVSGNAMNRVLRIERGSVRISGLTIADGTTSTSSESEWWDGTGGGVLNLDHLTLVDCVFRNNLATHGGALSCVTLTNPAACLLLNTTMTDNGAWSGGNAVFLYSDGNSTNSPTELTVSNSTLSGNLDLFTSLNTGELFTDYLDSGRQNFGGAILSFFSQVTIARSTIAENQAHVGGGLFNYGGQMVLRSTIVADNRALIEAPDLEGFVEVDAGTYETARILDSGYNLIGDASSIDDLMLESPDNTSLIGSGTHPISPGLARLNNYGGPTPTHALLTGSPAIDAGEAGVAGFDQRGYPRPNGKREDIGAFEWGASLQTVVPRLVADFLPLAQTFRIRFLGVPQRSYAVQSTTQLGNPAALWTVVGTATEVSPGSFVFEDSHSGGQLSRFYRVSLRE